MVRIPVEIEEDRVVRLPRNPDMAKPRAQIVLIGTIATTGIAQETWKESRRERGGNKRRKGLP